jgi:uncharacterized membrane protein
MHCRVPEFGDCSYLLQICSRQLNTPSASKLKDMNNKTRSIISYITPVGWLIAYFSGKAKADALLRYHLKQALGMALISITLNVVLYTVAYFVPVLSFLSITGLVTVIFWILGMINAANEAEKPVPVFGKSFEQKFRFIDQQL